MLLGCTAWVKLQALPVAVAMVAGGLAASWFDRDPPAEKPQRESLLLAGGFASALLLPLLAIAAAGIWTDWSDAYVRAGLSYLGSAQVGSGAALAWLYSRTGNLVSCIAAHATFNLVPFLMLALGWKFGDGAAGS
jgi:membrane protease YdiL (CAAX protease family)